MNKTQIYQIYYNEETKNKLNHSCIPLDNTKNERPDWFEFYPIINFLKKNTLEENTYYGFLSPSFQEKTNLNPTNIINGLKKLDPKFDVVTVSAGWDQIAFYKNPWEQGETWHKGLTEATNLFLKEIDFPIKIEETYGDISNTVFSNYIFAKKEYWNSWQIIANNFFDYIENDKNKDSLTSYGNRNGLYPLKTFIQERFASLILQQKKFNTYTLDTSLSGEILEYIFPLAKDINTRKKLIACDLLKKMYNTHGDTRYIEMYWKIRNEIYYTPPK